MKELKGNGQGNSMIYKRFVPHQQNLLSSRSLHLPKDLSILGSKMGAEDVWK